MRHIRKTPPRGTRGSQDPGRHSAWKLEDAKARFSEVVRRARDEGPQRVTVRGRDGVVIVAAEEFERLQPRSADRLPFVVFMESLAVDGLDLTRDRDLRRDVEL